MALGVYTHIESNAGKYIGFSMGKPSIEMGDVPRACLTHCQRPILMNVKKQPVGTREPAADASLHLPEIMILVQ
jgi:hypothetical protein